MSDKNNKTAFPDLTPFEWIQADPVIFDEETRAKYEELPDTEKTAFIIETLEQFYRNNIEYANFARLQIYNDPLLLLDFFRGIKKTHFKKCDIPLSSGEYKDRFKRLQELIIEAEIAIAKDPIDPEKLATIWPILRIRELFKESELASFYYLQNPRTAGAILKGGEYNSVPSGQYLFLLDAVITHTAAQRNFKFEVTKSGRKISDRDKALSVIKTKNGFSVTETKKGSVVSVSIINRDLIKSTAAVKLFIFLLEKAAQQNFAPVIHFQLKELVNRGMYSSIRNARAGFESHIEGVKTLQIGGKIENGKKTIDQESGVLFYHHKIHQNGVSVWVNENFDIEYLASYYTMLPAWAWSLSSGAFELVLYIFMRARANKKSSFNLSFSMIRERLALPTREEYAAEGKKFKAGQYVKSPILKAIDEIMGKIESSKDEIIKLDPHQLLNDESLEEWLNKSYLKITIKGEYKEALERIQKKQHKAIEESKRRAEAARAAAEEKAQQKR